VPAVFMVLRVWDILGGVIFLDSTRNGDKIAWLSYLNVSIYVDIVLWVKVFRYPHLNLRDRGY